MMQHIYGQYDQTEGEFNTSLYTLEENIHEGRFRSTFRSSAGGQRSPRFVNIYHNALPGQAQIVKNTLLAKKNVKAHRFKSQIRSKFDRNLHIVALNNSDFKPNDS